MPLGAHDGKAGDSEWLLTTTRPAHWEKRREEISAEIEVLVLEWLASDL